MREIEGERVERKAERGRETNRQKCRQTNIITDYQTDE